MPLRKKCNKIYGDAYLALAKFDLSEHYYLQNLQETVSFC